MRDPEEAWTDVERDLFYAKQRIAELEAALRDSYVYLRWDVDAEANGPREDCDNDSEGEP